MLPSDVDQRLACHVGGDFGFAVALKCDGYELDQGASHSDVRGPSIDGVGHPFSAADQRFEPVDELPWHWLVAFDGFEIEQGRVLRHEAVLASDTDRL